MVRKLNLPSFEYESNIAASRILLLYGEPFYNLNVIRNICPDVVQSIIIKTQNDARGFIVPLSLLNINCTLDLSSHSSQLTTPHRPCFFQRQALLI